MKLTAVKQLVTVIGVYSVVLFSPSATSLSVNVEAIVENNIDCSTPEFVRLTSKALVSDRYQLMLALSILTTPAVVVVKS